MEIKFNLKDAQVYIPSGRIMNIKGQLGWNELECTQSELEGSVKELIEQDFDKNVSYEGLLEKHVASTLDTANHKEQRKSRYKMISSKTIIGPEFYAEASHNLTEEMRQLMPSFANELMEHPEIKKRLAKIKQLKEFNQQ